MGTEMLEHLRALTVRSARRSTGRRSRRLAFRVRRLQRSTNHQGNRMKAMRVKPWGNHFRTSSSTSSTSRSCNTPCSPTCGHLDTLLTQTRRAGTGNLCSSIHSTSSTCSTSASSFTNTSRTSNGNAGCLRDPGSSTRLSGGAAGCPCRLGGAGVSLPAMEAPSWVPAVPQLAAEAAVTAGASGGCGRSSWEPPRGHSASQTCRECGERGESQAPGIDDNLILMRLLEVGVVTAYGEFFRCDNGYVLIACLATPCLFLAPPAGR